LEICVAVTYAEMVAFLYGYFRVNKVTGLVSTLLLFWH
jgi:hypothetical protein